MGDVEIVFRPFGKALVISRIVRGAGSAKPGVKVLGVLRIGDRRIEIGAAPEPGFAGDQEAGVHMDRGHMRVGHMRHQADARCAKTGVLGGRTVDGGGEFGRETTAHGRDIDPDLLEHPALHQPAGAAAGIVIALLLALPRGVVECGVRPGLAFDRLELGANRVAQLFEPLAGLFGLVGEIGHMQSLASVSDLRQ